MIQKLGPLTWRNGPRVAAVRRRGGKWLIELSLWIGHRIYEHAKIEVGARREATRYAKNWVKTEGLPD